MKKALAGVLAVALAGVMAGSATAQQANVQVYFDQTFTQAQTTCGTPGTLMDLYVVMNNWNMNVTGEDFSIDYSGTPFLTWLFDTLPYPDVTVSIGNSPTALGGIAIAYANCCTQDGFQAIYALRSTVMWGPGCDCGPGGGMYPLVVRGYTPLGKTQPSAIRREDFAEFSGVGLTSLICPGFIATEQSTWGGVKALYR